MSRPERWWRPSTDRRPGQRARARRMYTGKELDATFDTAYECGKIEQRRESQRLHDGVERLTDAIRASQEGDSGPLDDLAREAGVMASDDVTADISGQLVDEPDGLVDEAETYLRTYAAVLNGRPVEQLDDDESRALCTALGQVIAEITAARIGGQDSAPPTG